MKKRKRYARAKLIKKESEEEPTIIKLDTFKLSVLIGILITSLIISIPIFISTIIPWFIETFL